MIKGRFTMKYILSMLFPLSLLASGNFITPMEYSSQLYKNPRGIGCQNCHGESGEGKIVANYIHKKKERSFGGPAINKMNFNTFFMALNTRKSGMPRYFLTNKEIEALYLFVHRNDKKKSEQEAQK